MAAVVTDCLYRGVRTKAGTTVTVHRAPRDHLSLEGERAFDWGRPTAGAHALADALARDVFGDGAGDDLKERLFHEVVLALPFVDPWVLWRQELKDWAEAPTASG